MHHTQRKIAYIFPGQGAQYLEMGADFASTYPIAKQTFEEADDLLNRSLSREIFHGTRENLKETCTSQPALYVVSIAILRVIQQLFPDILPYVSAGLSLGEYTALTAAGILPFSKGVLLVNTRAKAMHEACLQNAGSMEVVMGLEHALVQEIVNTFTKGNTEIVPLWVANLNCPSQVVISGSLDALKGVRPLLEQARAKRVIGLEVAGAFHSGLMRSAQEALSDAIQECTFEQGSCKIVMNVPGDFVSKTDQQKTYLTQQVTHPVLWEKGIHQMEQASVTDYVEMGPGKTLSGMIKRILPERAAINIEKVEDLSKMESLYDR